MKKKIYLLSLAAAVLLALLQFTKIMTRPSVYRGGDCWPTNGFAAFYKMKPDTVDVLLFGSSIGVNNYDTQEIYDSYGIRTYNLSSVQQATPLSWYWLQEALRYQSPRVVMLETRCLYSWNSAYVMNAAEATFRDPLNQMRMSPLKVKCVKDYVAHEHNVKEASFYFPILRYHELWKDFDEDQLFGHDVYTQCLKGFAPGPDTIDGYEPLYLTDPGAVSEHELDPVMISYLDKIIELCKEKDIQVALVTIPGENMTDGMHNQIKAYADSKEVRYYDFDEAELFSQIGHHYPEETVYRHSNFGGAVRFSRLLGRILRDDFGVPAVHDEQYEVSRPYHEKLAQNAHMPFISDLAEYTDNLLTDRYVILIAGRHDAAGGLTEDGLKMLNALGLSTDWVSSAPAGGYLAVHENGIDIQEWYGPGTEVSGSIRDGRDTYTLRCATDDGESSSRIQINGKDYCANRKGLNIVVYDKELKYVVDSISLSSYSGGDCTIQR